MKDELSITMEILWIAGFWIVCSFFYFFCFNLPLFLNDDYLKPILAKIIFAAIILRNFSTLVISTLYCWIVVRSPNLVYAAEDPTSLKTLLDFELVMISVVPYSYFKRFVNRYALNGRSDSTSERNYLMPPIEEEPVYLYPIYLKLYTTLELLSERHSQLR